MINRDLWEIRYKKKTAAPKRTPTPGGTKTMGLFFFGGGSASALAMIGIAIFLGRQRRALRS